MARRRERRMEGIASMALLPGGSVSGHFIQLPHSVCYGIHGSVPLLKTLLLLELCCERECSRGEDYRLIKLSIMDFITKKEQAAVVECRGHDAALFRSVEHAHGWEEDVIGMVKRKLGKRKISISFECETLKADDAAQEHIKKYLPHLVGADAVVNIGQMSISGINFDEDDAKSGEEIAT